jgi:membrane protein
MKKVFIRLKISGKTLIQRLFITLELFGENGLANHAAAGAYGFLLSIAPMLLLIALFILAVINPSPHDITVLLGNLSFLDGILDEQWLTSVLPSVWKPGISGLISVLSILWAGRILALSMQRGLKIIFPGTKKRNPVTDSLVALVVEAVVLVFVLILIFGSQTALRLYKALNFFPETSVMYLITSKIEDRIFPVIALGLVSFIMYIFVPVNSPRKVSALWGALFCAFAYGCTSMAMGLILNKSTYNFLYGALGNLIILLINVHFFFTFFFMGAQLAFVTDSSEALIFAKLRRTRFNPAEKGNKGLVKRPKIKTFLFSSIESNLKKYCHFFKKGEIIFSQGDSADVVFYLLEGEVEITVSSSKDKTNQDAAKQEALSNVLKPGSFFGEMGYLLSEGRTATVIAKTDVSALALPPPVFDEILKYDTSLDRTIIENMSKRLKNSNEQIAALKSGNGSGL